MRGIALGNNPIIDVDELCDSLLTEVYNGTNIIAYVNIDGCNVDMYEADARELSVNALELSNPDDFMHDIVSVEYATYCTAVDNNNLSYVQRALVACNYLGATSLPPIMGSDEVLYIVWNHIMRTYGVSGTQPSDVAVLNMGDNIADYSAFQYGPQGDVAVSSRLVESGCWY